jgi:hypothetical protein
MPRPLARRLRLARASDHWREFMVACITSIFAARRNCGGHRNQEIEELCHAGFLCAGRIDGSGHQNFSQPLERRELVGGEKRVQTFRGCVGHRSIELRRLIVRVCSGLLLRERGQRKCAGHRDAGEGLQCLSTFHSVCRFPA